MVAKKISMEKISRKQAVPIIMGFIFFVISGCAAVGPDYKPISPDVPPIWHTDLHYGLSSSISQNNHTTLSRWWVLLKDPILKNLEQEAVKNNPDIKQAIEKLREVRALRGISYSGLFPSLNSSASAVRTRSSKNAGYGNINDFYQAGLDADWELDLFGGVRRSIEAADADIAAKHYSLDNVLVSLTAEVGLNYVNIRTLQARLTTAKNNLTLQQYTYELNKSRYRAGLIDELAVQQSRYNMEQTRSQIPQLKNELSTSMNHIAVLLGKKPGSLEKKLSVIKPVPAVPITVAVGIPAEAMRQRPDIRQAEKELAAATARIGVATADLYPKLTLKGSIGLESITMADLPKWASRTFSTGPSISWNIFDANAVHRNIDVQTSRQKQALIHYHIIVLKALEEVENALNSFVKEQDRHKALVSAAKAAGSAVLIAKDRFAAGLIDFSSVIDAQRSLFVFQDELDQSTGAVTTDLIRLYKALGGGWVSEYKTKKSNKNKLQDNSLKREAWPKQKPENYEHRLSKNSWMQKVRKFQQED